MKKIKHLSMVVLLLATVLVSCQKEEQHKEINNDDSKLKSMLSVLDGTIVLGQKVEMAGVDKSLLEGGVPTKFVFKWNEAESKLEVNIVKIQPGTMPFPVSMKSKATVMELSAWDKDIYKGNWIKFYDDNAETTVYTEDNTFERDNRQGATIVKGFYNVDTQEIEINIIYNMMNVVGYVIKQKIDKSLLPNFDEDLSVYEEALDAKKLDLGLESLDYRAENIKKSVEILGTEKTFPAKITYEGKTSEITLPLKFEWNGGEEYGDINKRMKVTLPKTVVAGNNMQISFEGNARFLSTLTHQEEDKHTNDDNPQYKFFKLNATEVPIILWSADGSSQTKTSNKGIIRIITHMEKNKVDFVYLNRELGLKIEVPLRSVE